MGSSKIGNETSSSKRIRKILSVTVTSSRRDVLPGVIHWRLYDGMISFTKSNYVPEETLYHDL